MHGSTNIRPNSITLSTQYVIIWSIWFSQFSWQPVLTGHWEEPFVINFCMFFHLYLGQITGSKTCTDVTWTQCYETQQRMVLQKYWLKIQCFGRPPSLESKCVQNWYKKKTCRQYCRNWYDKMWSACTHFYAFSPWSWQRDKNVRFLKSTFWTLYTVGVLLYCMYTHGHCVL